MRGGKKKVNLPVLNRQPNNREACTLLIALPKHYNKRSECYVIYEAACTSSLIQTDRRTDTGRDIAASIMKQIATKTLSWEAVSERC